MSNQIIIYEFTWLIKTLLWVLRAILEAPNCTQLVFGKGNYFEFENSPFQFNFIFVQV